MSHYDMEPKHNPAWRALLWTTLMISACVFLILSVWVQLTGNQEVAAYFLAGSIGSSLAAYLLGRKIVRS